MQSTESSRDIDDFTAFERLVVYPSISEPLRELWGVRWSAWKEAFDCLVSSLMPQELRYANIALFECFLVSRASGFDEGTLEIALWTQSVIDADAENPEENFALTMIQELQMVRRRCSEYLNLDAIIVDKICEETINNIMFKRSNIIY